MLACDVGKDVVRAENLAMLFERSTVTVLGEDVAAVHFRRTVERHNDWRLFFFQLAQEIHSCNHVTGSSTRRPVAGDEIDA